MLRDLFVITLILIGIYYSLQKPIYALLFYLWRAYFWPEAWVWSNWIRMLDLSFWIGAYVTVASVVSGAKFHLKGRTWILPVFALHSFISCALSTRYASSYPYWEEFARVLVISYLITVLIDDLKKFRLALIVICLSLGFEGIKQGWVHLLTTPGARNLNKIYFLGDNNATAVGMLVLVPWFIALVQTAAKPHWKWFFGFSAVGALYRALSTYSRGGFLAFVALAGTFWLRSRRKIAVLFPLLLVSGLILPVLPQSFWDRMDTIVEYDEEGSAISRLHIWGVAAKMGQRHPYFGTGFRTFHSMYDRYDSSEGLFGNRRSVHSMWFGAFAELGYPGLGLFVLFFVLSLLACHRLRKRSKNRPRLNELFIYTTAMESALVALAVGGSFLTFHYKEIVWHIFALVIALELIGNRLIREEDERESAVQGAETAASDPVAVS